MKRAPLFLALLLATACATRHQARGVVLDVNPADATVRVSHEAIPGYMDAMVMRFTAKEPRELADVRPGDRIAFRVRVEDGRTGIDRIRLLSAARVDAGLARSPASPVLAGIGEPVADFTLTDQHGEPRSLTSLRGKVVAITFIYTRCPLPDYCPRMMANLEAVRRRFSDRLGRDLTFLTVTFDPTHDTPAVLRTYAENFKADVPGWYFLTGSASDIARVCSIFGVEFWPDEGLISHTLQTAVIDRNGRLSATVEGKDYSGRQLADLVESALAAR